MNYIKKIEWLLENRVQTKIEHNGIASTWEVDLFNWKARGHVSHPAIHVMGATFEGTFNEALRLLSEGKYGKFHIECPDPKNNKRYEDWGDLGGNYYWLEVLDEC